mmetsp:Transcript_29436/g.96052  ORF Transcript_29436/g.96052 Transcript_29436/m.96052 type:complete len:222 (+) Transcript_29436:322-987(+)
MCRVSRSATRTRLRPSGARATPPRRRCSGPRQWPAITWAPWPRAGTAWRLPRTRMSVRSPSWSTRSRSWAAPTRRRPSSLCWRRLCATRRSATLRRRRRCAAPRTRALSSRGCCCRVRLACPASCSLPPRASPAPWPASPTSWARPPWATRPRRCRRCCTRPSPRVARCCRTACRSTSPSCAATCSPRWWPPATSWPSCAATCSGRWRTRRRRVRIRRRTR